MNQIVEMVRLPNDTFGTSKQMVDLFVEINQGNNYEGLFTMGYSLLNNVGVMDKETYNPPTFLTDSLFFKTVPLIESYKLM